MISRIPYYFLFLLILIYPFLAGLGRLFPYYLAEGVNLFPAIKELLSVLLILFVSFNLLARKNIKLSGAVVLLLAMVLFDFLQIVASPYSLGAVLDGIRLQSVFPVLALFLILDTVNSRRQILIPFNTILLVIVLQSLVVTSVAYAEMIYPTEVKNMFGIGHSAFGWAKNIRIASLMVNQINLGIYECIAMSAMICLLYFSRGIQKVLLLGCVLASLPVIAMTFSRNAYALLVFLTVLNIMFQLHRVRIKNVLSTIVVITIVVLVIVYIGSRFLIITDLIVYRASTMDPGVVAGTTGRFIKWGYLFNKHILDSLSSFLFGNGIGFGLHGYGFFSRIENSYIYILGEKGVIGLALYIGVLLRFAYTSLSCLFRRDRKTRVQGLFFITIFGIITISSFTSDAFISFPHVFYFWLFFAYSEIFFRSTRVENPVPIQLAYS